ncbi:hypothetical protein HYW46_03690 [Candidatus Daviesbacteria bacterium]|nr:hypothetical protein [Candidatus Daviesbacteria bacterium]
MNQRHEGVHDAGKTYRDVTGHLHPNVDIVGKKPRESHNAMVPSDEPGTYLLTHGVSLPVLSLFDGTGSTSQYVGDFFRTAERQYKLLDGVRTRYNPQLATGVVNDFYNVHNDGLPVVQVSQFESDERSAEQVRLLQPASMGNDSSAEDYDLGLYYALSVYADTWTYYGLKGYLTIALDEIGRGFVTAEGVREYLGQAADFLNMATEEICRQLLEHWHPFVLQVPTYTGRLLPYTTDWWAEKLGGRSRIIQVENPGLLADVRAALVYVTEASKPSKQGLIEFLRTGDKVTIDAANLNQVWRMVQVAQEHFGAQSKLPGYQDIPRPGDVFAHYRHAWPISHSRQGENVTPLEADS